MIRVKNLLERHRDKIPDFFKYRVTNAAYEGLNSKILLYKTSARGSHSFKSYRIRTLFYCGKLNMAVR